MAWHEAGDLLLGFIRLELGRRRGLNPADEESVQECRGMVCSKQAMISHDVMGSRATVHTGEVDCKQAYLYGYVHVTYVVLKGIFSSAAARCLAYLHTQNYSL
jgi:hypothetical protein